MKIRKSVVLGLLIITTLTNAAPAIAETRQAPGFHNQQSPKRDTIWNGILIGAGIGAVAGMLVAPPAFCGSNDSECAAIVRVAIGLPAIAGGIGIGALVDGLQSRRGTAVSGAQITWRF
jgi:hypothetical protein